MNTFLLLSITFVVLGISLYAIFSRYNNRKDWGATLPLGKKGWPIIGETLEFIQLANKGNPEKFITDRMIKYSPKVFLTSLMGQRTVVFCGASGNKCLFSSNNNFVTPWLPPSIKKILISPDNTRGQMSSITKETRSVINVFIKPEALQQKFVGVMDCVSRQHIENEWAPHREVLACELVKKYTISLVCRVFMSIEDPKEVARIEGLFEGITAGMFTIPINFPGTTFNRAIKYAGLFRKLVLETIQQRKKDLLDKRSDILSYILLSSYEDIEFHNDTDIVDLVLGLFHAGHETSSTVLTHIVKYLAELPHIYAEVLKEQLEIANNKKPGELLNWKDIQQMKYSWSVANETMRLAPPAPGTFREVIADFTYAGFTIPKGCKAYWTVHSTNKTSKYFKNPEKFDPSRFQGNGPASYSFAPFGGGTHICPGREFARTQILVFIHNLVTRFELEKLLPNEKTIYNVKGGVPANGLPIRLHPRNGHIN